ncbi:hypothetical protein Tco_0004620 [Tanacetum coccineum]
MHTSKDDYLINTLRFVSAKEATQIYGAVLPECLTSPVMKESKAYKTYLGYATGVVPPKMARKFKKASPSKKDSDLVPVDEEPVQKGKRVKRPAKKSTTKPAAGVVIREAPVETKSKSKEKEKVDVTRGKGIELLSEVALTEEAQMKEVRKKSLRDFHKTHPSGSGTVAEKPPSVDKITPTVTSEGTGDKPGVPDVTEDDSTESESESWGNDEDDSNNDQDSSNEDSEQENESEEQVSDSEQEEESKDDDQEEEEFVHTPSPTDDKDDDNLESESDDVNKSNEESDDVNKSDEDVIKGDKEIVQGEGADAEMIDAQQGNGNLETTQEQVVKDAHVTISTVTKKTEVLTHAPTLLIVPVSVITESSPVYTNIPQSSQVFTPPPPLATLTLPPTIETTNPLSTLPDFASVFRFNERITALEKEVVELKKDPLHTQVTTLVDEHLDTRLGETREEFMNFLSESLTARIKEQVKDHLPQILPKEVSNFAPPVIEALIKESRDEVTLAKVYSQPHSTYEATSTLTEFELKKILIDKMEKNFFFSYGVYSLKRSRKDKDKDEDPFAGSDRGLKKRKLSKDAEPTTGPKKKDSTSGSSKGTKSQPKSFRKSIQLEEPVFEVAGSDIPQDQEGNLGDNEDEPRNETASRTFKLLKGTRSNYAELEYDFEECYKALSEKLDWENPEGSDYPFDLSKPLPLIKRGKHQRVPFEYFINNDLMYLQGEVSTMTYTTSTTKSKAAQYDLSGIEDMVPNIWSLVKVAYDRYVLWGISHWREQRKSFYAYARGRKSRGDVYSTKRILVVTHVKVIRKHGYGYLEEIVVRRVDNVLYRFKEGDFPRLRINDIEDMLILVVQNRLTNLSGDDVADFAIALRMFTRSLVIQKRVEDLQLRVESYQKKINVTKPDTTRPDLRKRHPYTPYKDP